ncbi:N-alpha-acetyltransferase 30 NatC catalytic subunit [Clonorchis sinensis]|uniref:N-alpha-acetyltransferase 30 NatC catalytic subunit n=1 Tax=Clonorchis sinensis TaxID=79923 RepID=G7YCU9_CLOSI|nr:N-alpha-acetyltransferase 30 NatC catalytic subunit [Clonorchis sinensis]
MANCTEECLSSELTSLRLVEQPNESGNVAVQFLFLSTVSNSILHIDHENNIQFRQYRSEEDLQRIMPLISKDLSEPYSIYTYRYFIYNWPKLCILVSAYLSLKPISRL